jgi:hypothetical protein
LNLGLLSAGEGRQFQNRIVTNKHHAVIGVHHATEFHELLTRSLLESLRLIDPRRNVGEIIRALPLSSLPLRGGNDVRGVCLAGVSRAALGQPETGRSR